jgi:hypothetical protein
METIQDGQPSTEYMKFGDTIRIEMKGKDGQSVFGAIDQKAIAAPVPLNVGAGAQRRGAGSALLAGPAL